MLQHLCGFQLLYYTLSGDRRIAFFSENLEKKDQLSYITGMFFYDNKELGIMFKKICFTLLTAAFFFVPWIWSPARDWAPGSAVLAGIIFSVCWGNPFAGYTSKYTSQLLGATIVGMGFGMNLIEVLRAGGSGFIYTFAGIVLGIGLGTLLGKTLKVSPNTAALISVGTSICGGSEIGRAHV